jgi:hypothetical protein
MLSYISNHLRTLNGFVGYIEVDNELRLVENSTLTGDEKVTQLVGLFISFLRAYEAAGRNVKTIAIACGTSVYVGLTLPTGFLVVQMARHRKLAGVRRALISIVNDAHEVASSAVTASLPKEATIPAKALEIAVQPVTIVDSVWPEFRVDFFKILSPIAPENILQRLLANAFKKSNIEVTSELDHSQISQIVTATLDEIPNAARRKSAEGEAAKLLKKYGIQR